MTCDNPEMNNLMTQMWPFAVVYELTNPFRESLKILRNYDPISGGVVLRKINNFNRKANANLKIARTKQQ